MNNLLKNSLLALTFICIVVLIVFCIQLIVINSGVEPVSPGGVFIGESAQDGDSTDDYDDEEADYDDTQPDDNEPFDPWRPQQIGERHEILITENSRLIAYADENLFEFAEDGFEWTFNYIAGGAAALEIGYVLVTIHGIEASAIEFLNEYSGSQGSMFTGEMTIPGTTLTGYHVSTHHLGRTYEAWIQNLLDSDVSLVFILTYENATQRDALYQVLGSIHIEAVGSPSPPEGDDETNGDG